jgi:diaminohydroxyphosphoribosylaminopyrimidine deaminase/5-amino-6-(5-phosphoribosylamino)uracil reductase
MEAGIRRVVAAVRDPDPRVDGGGFRALRRHGVRVESGLLGRPALLINRPFAKWVREGLPWVTLKAAMSLDGRIATRTGDAKWITGSEARGHARALRAENDAVMVGIGTVLADDPRLDPRSPPPMVARRPLRVVMDSRLRLPISSKLVRRVGGGALLVFSSARADRARALGLRERGVEVEAIPERGRRLDLKVALRRLGRRGVSRLLVEGGGELNASFIDAGLADRFILYLSPRLIGGEGARGVLRGRGVARVAASKRVRLRRQSRIGEALLLEFDFRR